MQNKKYGFIIFCFLCFLLPSAHAVQLDTRVVEFENQLRTNFEQFVQRVFDFQISAKVIAIVDKSKNLGSLEVLDTGYMQNPRLNSATTTDNQINQLRITSLNVELYLNKGVSPEFEKQVRTLATSYFSRYNPKIAIKTLSFDSENEEQKREKKEKEIRESSRKSSQFNFIIIGLAFLVGAILLLIGIYDFSKSFMGGFTKLSNALLGLKPSAIKEPPKPDTAAPKPDLKEKPQVIFDKDVVAANIAVVKQMLQSYQYEFIKTLGQNKNNKLGLKWLLPQFNDIERAHVKNLVDDSFFLEADSVSPDFNPILWLQNFSENLIVSQLTSQNDPLQNFEKDEIREILQWPKATVAQIARESNDPAVWSVAKTILNQTELFEVTKSFSANDWATYIKGFTYNNETLKSGFKKIKAGLQAMSGSQHKTSKIEGVKTLLPQLIESIKNQPFGKEQEFIDTIVSAEPQIKILLEDSIWTPTKLKLIPERYMKTFLQSLDVETAFQFLISLPDDTSSWLKSLVPEGNRKILINDLLTKAEKHFENQNKLAAHMTARSLVDQLMIAHQQEAFKLNEPLLDIKDSAA